MRKSVILIICATLLWGCTTLSKNYKLGYQESMNKNWDKAIEYYERAILEDPSNSYYRLGLVRARVSASTVHWTEARRLAIDDKVDEALAAINEDLDWEFEAEEWGKKWARVRCLLPYTEDTPPSEIAPVAASAMKTIIERTWPLIRDHVNAKDEFGGFGECE